MISEEGFAKLEEFSEGSVIIGSEGEMIGSEVGGSKVGGSGVWFSDCDVMGSEVGGSEVIGSRTGLKGRVPEAMFSEMNVVEEFVLFYKCLKKMVLFSERLEKRELYQDEKYLKYQK